jgi:hypothetical protein
VGKLKGAWVKRVKHSIRKWPKLAIKKAIKKEKPTTADAMVGS